MASMETVITALVIIVGIITTLLMAYLTVQVYRGEARPEDREAKHKPPHD